MSTEKMHTPLPWELDKSFNGTMATKVIKFTGPLDKLNIDFRKLPTPMVKWSGTAKELHDIILKAWINSEPMEKRDAGDE